MKYSIYNSIIFISKTAYLLYNAFADKYIICKAELVPLLQKSSDHIESAYPIFYKQLLQGGFLIKEDVDEIKQVIDYGIQKCINSSEYHLIINPTINCNFQCWYCYENHSAYTKMNEETICKVKKLILNICSNKRIKFIHLSFFGGEPLLYYKDVVQPIINFIRDCNKEYDFNYKIHFTTNGFLITEYVRQHLSLISQDNEPKSFQITLDGHREMHNKVRHSASGDGSYDRIISNIKKLLESHIEVTLRINFATENIESVQSILNDLKDIPNENRELLKIDFQKVWQDNDIEFDSPLLNEAIEAFKKEFGSVSDHYHGVDSLREPCYGDLVNECIVNYNGDIYKCTARDFTQSNRLGYLTENGDIKWNNPNFIEQRLQDKFNKRICKRCRIFPICGAGCAQTALEAEKNKCIRCKDEQEKDKIILARFYDRVVKYHKK